MDFPSRGPLNLDDLPLQTGLLMVGVPATRPGPSGGPGADVAVKGAVRR